MKRASTIITREALADLLKLSEQNIAIDAVHMTEEGDLQLVLSGAGLPIGCETGWDRVRMVYKTEKNYGYHRSTDLLVMKVPKPDPKAQYLSGDLSLSAAAEAVLSDPAAMKKAALDYLVSNNTI